MLTSRSRRSYWLHKDRESPMNMLTRSRSASANGNSPHFNLIRVCRSNQYRPQNSIKFASVLESKSVPHGGQGILTVPESQMPQWIIAFWRWIIRTRESLNAIKLSGVVLLVLSERLQGTMSAILITQVVRSHIWTNTCQRTWSKQSSTMYRIGLYLRGIDPPPLNKYMLVVLQLMQSVSCLNSGSG